MLSGEFVQTVVAGIVGGGISISTIPLLMKGDLLFRREIDRADAAHKENTSSLRDGYERQISDQSETIEKLEAANARLETELREQYRAAIDQNRQLIAAVDFLKGLGGLAAQNRRSGSD